MRSTPRIGVTMIAGALGLALAGPAAASDLPATPSVPADRAAQFAAAATEFGVPSAVLLSVSYNESLWEDHAGTPSTTGAYGPMGLTEVAANVPSDKGEGAADAPALHTLDTAAGLLRVDPATLRTDPAANIRGGAALLASYAKSLDHGALPHTDGGWYGAVAEYASASTQDAAADFADSVYATIASGAARFTQDGQYVDLPSDPMVLPDTASIVGLNLPAANAGTAGLPQCPKTLQCSYVPAAYAQNGPDKTDYGNYDLADRPNNHLTVNYIVIHDTEESYAGTVAGFQNPAQETSANYVVQGTSGTVTQMVPDQDVAWHAGNWYMNMHAVGIEQVGYAVQGATWFTERLYQTTASLVRYLAAKYHVQIDRQHIIGHDNVPGIAPAYIAGMHWDPGPFWDWNHFMTLLGHPTERSGLPNSPMVTINPVFAQNIQTVTDCEAGQPVPAQAASFVYLRTAPNATAPLFNDPGLNPTGTVGTTCAADWGDKASAGQQFVVAGRQGDWVAIWWDGAKVWFENPKGHQVITPSSGFVVAPKPGETSVPTYGVAYPDPSEFPAGIPVRAITPLPYTITPGQSYVYGGVTPTDFYNASTIDNSAPDDHTDVLGSQRYLEIQLGHRVAFVNAADVQLVPVI
ncbi:MAG TPA: N-acetylmuramoyl-L-alanine amidase [Pseudonocardiaceae bacterium]|nr:N-acetylmuramoyl-L-alanine amidase [Pseudonocardiaceae bacterium]